MRARHARSFVAEVDSISSPLRRCDRCPGRAADHAQRRRYARDCHVNQPGARGIVLIPCRPNEKARFSDRAFRNNHGVPPLTSTCCDVDFEFRSAALATGAQYSYAFPTAGAFTYHDSSNATGSSFARRRRRRLLSLNDRRRSDRGRCCSRKCLTDGRVSTRSMSA